MRSSRYAQFLEVTAKNGDLPTLDSLTPDELTAVCKKSLLDDPIATRRYNGYARRHTAQLKELTGGSARYNGLWEHRGSWEREFQLPATLNYVELAMVASIDAERKGVDAEETKDQEGSLRGSVKFLMRSTSDALAAAERFAFVTDVELRLRVAALAIVIGTARQAVDVVVKHAGIGVGKIVHGKPNEVNAAIKRQFYAALYKQRKLQKAYADVLDSLDAREFFRHNPELFAVSEAGKSLDEMKQVIQERYPVA